MGFALRAAMLDLFYYRPLLEGTVKAIIDPETKYPDIQVSTEIQHNEGPALLSSWHIVHSGAQASTQ